MQDKQHTPIISNDLITLADAAKIIPRRRGNRIHTSTLVRWGKAGKITLYVANGYRVSEGEIRAKFAPRVVRP